MTVQRWAIEVTGIVQGVGYRPFVYKLAVFYHLTGWVYNHSAGVSIEVEGAEEDCRQFLQHLESDAPAIAAVETVTARRVEPVGSAVFEIRESEVRSRTTLVSPDMGICEDCLADLRDPANRRYRYAFTNCTNCGPRFTIIRDLPYDRPQTTMAQFAMCEPCLHEYHDPLDRRFHAQPNACADCGPQLTFWDAAGNPVAGEPLALAHGYLDEGKILAVKGLGGYHLVCDAANAAAVEALRSRKYRWDKPFAVMAPDLAAAERYCSVTEEEAALLTSQRRPIVLLRKKEPCMLPEQLAPGNGRLGVMLPYTPLHYLLMEGHDLLVMTSGNRSDEPILYEDEHVAEGLKGIADGFLTHNRPIFRRCDDSVMFCAAGAPRFIRRARGFAPQPVPLQDGGVPVLAVGGEQKNTFCLTRGEEAFLSQHIGDLENEPTLQSFTREITYFEKMFQSTPHLLAYDMHPEYLSTKYALKSSTRGVAVQHHHAHLASVLAEHGCCDTPAIGFIYDGTGYGTDGTLWGGEVLVGDCAAFTRCAALRPLQLPGGAKAIREPWRVALSLLQQTYGQDAVSEHAPAGLLRDGWQILLQAMQAGINAPTSSGMGRLFDGIAALLDLGRTVNYEGQAAIALEQVMEPAEGSYPYSLEETDGFTQVDWRPTVRAVLLEQQQGIPAGCIAARFHQTVVTFSLDIAERIRQKQGLSTVVFSGGCWQNIFLLEQAQKQFKAAGFTVLLNQNVPANDGGLSYGQAAVAATQYRKGLIPCV